MAIHKIKKGLDLPISGEPAERISEGQPVSAVALMAADSVGLRPRMLVAVGDTVKRGQVLYEEKKMAGVRFAAPGAGTVAAIHRGDKRALISVVVELNERERGGQVTEEDETAFDAFSGKDPAGLSGDEVKALLLESGQWTALRARPFGKVANPEDSPHSIFVTAIDTNPLAPSVEHIVRERKDDFQRGLLCISKLTEGKVYLCRAPGSEIEPVAHSGIEVEEFEGIHPAGTVGLHIHLLDPVHRDKTVWHIGYQDVTAVGSLFKTGKLDLSRVVSLAGPSVRDPKVVRTRLGASTEDLCKDSLKEGENRIISGSVFSGRMATGNMYGYLGRHHNQITVLREGREREFMGWAAPGMRKFSSINLFVSRLFPGKKLDFTTTTHGSKRAMVPIGMYERVMPMDILPTFLLRALLMQDIERAEQLGCLELDEEDLALCTFVCPGKQDYGQVLRENLTRIEKEG